MMIRKDNSNNNELWLDSEETEMANEDNDEEEIQIDSDRSRVNKQTRGKWRPPARQQST